MTTGPQDPASRDRLRAGHADRDLVIEALKTAFVDGRLTKTELIARTGRALAAQTYADLASLTADIPAAPPPAMPVPAVPVLAESAATVPSPDRPPAPEIRRPLAKAAAISGVFLVIAATAIDIGAHLDPGVPGPNPDHSWVGACVFVALAAVMIALLTVTLGVVTSIEQRRSRRQRPPGSGTGGRTLDDEGKSRIVQPPAPTAR